MFDQVFRAVVDHDPQALQLQTAGTNGGAF